MKLESSRGDTELWDFFSFSKNNFDSLECLFIDLLNKKERPSAAQIEEVINRNPYQNYGEALVYLFKNDLLNEAEALLDRFEKNKEVSNTIWTIHLTKTAGKKNYISRIQSYINNGLEKIRCPLEQILISGIPPNLEKLKKIIENDPIQNYGQAILMASRCQYWNVVDCLIESYNKNKKLRHTIWSTHVYEILANCAFWGQLNLVNKILRLDLDYSTGTIVNAIKFADGNDNIETIKCLIDSLEKIDLSLFFSSAKHGNIEGLDYLAECFVKDADNVCIDKKEVIRGLLDKRGRNLLHIAVLSSKNKLKVVKFLLDCGIAPKKKDVYGFTPLQLLLKFGDYMYFSNDCNGALLNEEDVQVAALLLKSYSANEINIPWKEKKHLDYYRKEILNHIEKEQWYDKEKNNEVFKSALKNIDYDGLKRLLAKSKHLDSLKSECPIDYVLKKMVIKRNSCSNKNIIKILNLLFKYDWPITENDLSYIKSIKANWANKSVVRKKKNGEVRQLVRFVDHKINEKALQKVVCRYNCDKFKTCVTQICTCSFL